MESGYHRVHGSHGKADVGAEKLPPVIANACLLVVSLSGAALLVWWLMEFHPSNRQLWMVPLGLVMAGTPVVMWFSVLASGAYHRFELLPARRPSPPATSQAPNLEKGLKSSVCSAV